jgi:hypothetical protein
MTPHTTSIRKLHRESNAVGSHFFVICMEISNGDYLPSGSFWKGINNRIY